MLKLPAFPHICSPDLEVPDGEYNITNCDSDRLIGVKAIVQNQILVVVVEDGVLEELFNHTDDGDSVYFISKDEDISDFYSWASS